MVRITDLMLYGRECDISLEASKAHTKYQGYEETDSSYYAGSWRSQMIEAQVFKCPRQPGCTECGYFVLKFMKEIVKHGVRALENDNIGDDSNEFTDADFDDIREEWAIYVSNFIFR
ncbi:hypothetical protein CTI12_AA427570 [Artemisia annua]|uniref:Ulp1 protease family, C-terminal catalytic domain-containing protein n=1 Tax=Artemisia annua TaxID=35608 RepID=A0A2U1LT17_ARTAN|nr:hypothetical protein CTI12_AA427570 [Artemisia annua]